MLHLITKLTFQQIVACLFQYFAWQLVIIDVVNLLIRELIFWIHSVSYIKFKNYLPFHPMPIIVKNYPTSQYIAISAAHCLYENSKTKK